jgi:hypothetical protein
VFEYLAEHGLSEEALQEKREAVELWSRIRKLSLELESGSKELIEFIRISAEYGYRLFQAVYEAWSALLEGYLGQRSGSMNWQRLGLRLSSYDEAWAHYQELASIPGCPTLYKDCYLYLPGEPVQEGLGASIAEWREECRLAAAAGSRGE